MMRSRYYCMGLVAAVGGSGWDTPHQVCLSASLSLCLSVSASLPLCRSASLSHCLSASLALWRSASLSLCLSLSLLTILTYSLATLQSDGGTYRADRTTCDSRVRSQPGDDEAPLIAL